MENKTIKHSTVKINLALNIASLTSIVVLAISMGVYAGKMEQKISNLEEHANSKEIHQPMSEKMKLFVPRMELDNRLDNVESTLSRIEIKLDK